MAIDQRDLGRASNRVVVMSPSGVPAVAWRSTHAARSSPEETQATGVAIARMTLVLQGDTWVRADVQEPLSDDAGTGDPALDQETPKSWLVLPDDEAAIPGPIAYDAEVITPGAAARSTRLRGGLATLIVAGEGANLRSRFQITALNWYARRARLVADLRAVFPCPTTGSMRLLLAIDEEGTEIGDEESTLTTPGGPKGAPLPFLAQHGNVPPAPGSSPQRTTEGLPFPGEAGGSAAPTPANTAYPGQSRTMYLPARPATGARPSGAPPAPAMPPVQAPPMQAPPMQASPWAPATAPLSTSASPPAIAMLSPVAATPAASVRPPSIVGDPAVVRPFSAADASDRATDGSARGTSTAGEPQAATRDALDLLWLAPACGDRLRAPEAWRKLLRDEERDDDDQLYDPSDATADAETQRAVLAIMLRAERTSRAGFAQRLRRAFGPRGAFRAPLVLADGTLHLAFDEMATLAAYCAATKAQAPVDAKFAETWTPCAEIAAAADPLVPTIDLDNAIASLRVAYALKPRPVSALEIDRRVTHALAMRRRYRAIELKGEPWVRASLGEDGDDRIVTYLPAACAAQLPVCSSLASRLILALVPPQDTSESEPVAALVVAIARPAPPLSERKD